MDFGLDKFAKLQAEKAKEKALEPLPDLRPPSIESRYPFKLQNEFSLGFAGITSAPRGKSPVEL